jgi:hypothetical protein
MVVSQFTALSGIVGGMKGRTRRWLARLALAAAASIVALGLAEVVARKLERPGGFVYQRPESGAMFQLTGDDQVYEPIPSRGLFNALGLRDRAYDRDKPDGVRRVVVLGDSVTYGPTLPLEGTFDNQLEDRLIRASDGHVEVLNLAVPGYNSEQEAARLRLRALDLDPDLVVVMWTINDFEATPTVVVTDDGVHYVHHERPGIPLALPLAPRLQVDLLRTSAFARMASRSLALTTARLTGAEEVRALELGKAANSLALVEIAELAASTDAGVLFVLFPLLGEDGGRRQVEDAAAFLDASGLPYLDLGPTMRGRDVMSLRSRSHDPMHPSVEACSLAAGVVAQRVLADGLLDAGAATVGRAALTADRTDVEAAAAADLSAWLEGEVLPGDADPLSAADRRFADDRGEASRAGADLRTFVAATCGERLCLGIELAAKLGEGLALQVDFAPFKGRGAGGRIVLRAGRADATLEMPPGHPQEIPIRTTLDGREIRIRLPMHAIAGCETACELHVGPATVVDADGDVLDDLDLRYRIGKGTFMSY